MFSMALHSRSDSLATRGQILTAATVIAVNGGPQALTIDAVAKEAKMSKGGVLYHFPSKDALIRGMMRMHFEGFWSAFHRFWKEDARKERRWHRAWIKATFEGMRRADEMENPALFMMVHSTPEHSQYLRRHFLRLQTCLQFDGVDRISSRLLVNSIAGLRFERLFRICWQEDITLEALEGRCLELLETFVVSKGGQDP